MEIIPKPPRKIPPWQSILFYSSLAVILIVFASYFILDHFVSNFSQELEQLKETLAREKTEEETSLEREIFSYQKKIDAFAGLIKNHLFTSKSLTFLEKTCHPKIQFSQFSLSSSDRSISLSGEAEDFNALGQQLLILKDEPGVENLNLSNISIGRQGEIEFTLKLSFDSQFFQK